MWMTTRPASFSQKYRHVSVLVDRTGDYVEQMIVEERQSSSAPIRMWFHEQRKITIEESCEKVSHHEFFVAQAQQDRRILQEELLRQQQDFR